MDPWEGRVRRDYSECVVCLGKRGVGSVVGVRGDEERMR